MKQIRMIPFCALFLSFNTLSDSYYVGVGANSLFWDIETSTETPYGASAYGILGKNFSEHFSLEVRAGLGLVEGRHELQSLDIDYGLQSFQGVYLKTKLPLSDFIEPYLSLGYAGGEIKISSGAASATSYHDNFSYGAGLALNFDDFSVSAEAMHYFDFTEMAGQTIERIRLNSVGIHVSFPFNL